MSDRTPIFRSLAVIEEGIREKLTVEGLAASVHFSKYHYQRMFREAVGDSVMGYVARRRVILAAEELAGTDNTVLEIALKYGFDSHEGFTRSFKAHMGVTPTDYRKYHSAIGSLRMEKERSAMKYSKTTHEIIGELNSLIVQAKETAAYTRKSLKAAPQAVSFYSQVWEFAARRAENLADQLTGMLEGIMVISRCPDEISARFTIIKAVEDAAFEGSVIAFQTGLTMARAKDEHKEVFGQLCRKYEELAGNARVKADKIAGFFQELAVLIFQDMRETGQERLLGVIEAGRAAAERLKDPSMPYVYIAEEITDIVQELSGTPLENVTILFLEDCSVRLETIAFASHMDMLRIPSHEQLFDGIEVFREKMDQALEFFKSLPQDAAAFSCQKTASERREDKAYMDLAFQESILLFHLKGEIQKLGDDHLDQAQKEAFTGICHKLDRAVRLAGSGRMARSSRLVRSSRLDLDMEGGTEDGRIRELIREAYEGMAAEADRLGAYGGAVRYIAEEIIRPVSRLEIR